MSAALPVPYPQALRGATGLFALAAAFAAFWLGLNFALPGLHNSGIPLLMSLVLIHAAMLSMMWLALARIDVDVMTRWRTWLAVAIPFTLWLAMVWWLAVDGAFRSRPPNPLVALPLSVFLPLLIGLPWLLRSTRVADMLDATPASWLIGLQVYRLLGGIFLVDWSRGELSGTFAIPAGVGDIVVGLLALPVAWLLHVGARGGKAMAIAWNVLGLIDFAVAIVLGFLSSPGPLQLIIPDGSNTQLGLFPAVLIPAFTVPSSILVHALSLRQLRRSRA